MLSVRKDLKKGGGTRALSIPINLNPINPFLLDSRYNFFSYLCTPDAVDPVPPIKKHNTVLKFRTTSPSHANNLFIFLSPYLGRVQYPVFAFPPPLPRLTRWKYPPSFSSVLLELSPEGFPKGKARQGVRFTGTVPRYNTKSPLTLPTRAHTESSIVLVTEAHDALTHTLFPGSLEDGL